MTTPAELVAFVRDKIGCGYVFGSTGELITEAFIQAKAAQYKEMYTAGYISSSRKWIGHIAFDCSGLIRKATGTSTNAHGYYSKATESGKIGTIPEIPGVLVFMARRDGTMYHVGVYVGNGKVIEAKGVAYGVVETTGRNWSHWGKCHAVNYGTESTSMLLKIGSIGDEVKTLQSNLNVIGDYGLVVDGDFGAKTETAVKDFQLKHGLAVDGIVGGETQKAIATALAPVDPIRQQIKELNEKVTFLTNLVGSGQLRVNSLIADLATANTNNDILIEDLRTLARIIRKYEV